MPGFQKLTINEVRDRIEKYGYYLLDDTVYKNQRDAMKLYDAQLNKIVHLSLVQINYQVQKGYRSEFDIYNILNMPEVQQQARQHMQLSGIQRFVNKLRKYSKFNSLNQDMINLAYQHYKLTCQKLNKKRNFDIDFANSPLGPDLMLFILIQSADAIKKKMNKRLTLHIIDYIV